MVWELSKNVNNNGKSENGLNLRFCFTGSLLGLLVGISAHIVFPGRLRYRRLKWWNREHSARVCRDFFLNDEAASDAAWSASSPLILIGHRCIRAQWTAKTPADVHALRTLSRLRRSRFKSDYGHGNCSSYQAWQHRRCCCDRPDNWCCVRPDIINTWVSLRFHGGFVVTR